MIFWMGDVDHVTRRGMAKLVIKLIKKTRLAFGFTILNPSQSDRKELKYIKAAEASVETGKRGE